jgi:hypothetical protein
VILLRGPDILVMIPGIRPIVCNIAGSDRMPIPT